MTVIPYLEHLSDADLSLLSAASLDGESVDDLLTHLRTSPGYLDALLQSPRLYAALFGPGEEDAFLRATPFLVFATLVHRVAHDLAGLSFIDEWVGPGRRVPMFEVGNLREFAAHPVRRLFLAELLASYTHVASGSFWVQTSRGLRRRRFSELDPLRLIEMLDVVPDAERPSIYRRLGDLSLFLTGVFPDYAGGRLLAPTQRRRLARALPPDPGGSSTPGADTAALAGLHLLEQLGSRSYRAASIATQGPGGILGDVSEGFGQARRMLNLLTDRYLFPYRDRWFPLAGA
jgi:hypothetical protein